MQRRLAVPVALLALALGQTLLAPSAAVILIAQVAPANAAGTVQFKDGESALGRPRPVIGGFVLIVTSMLTEGTHSLTAAFTPADRVAFSPSTPPPVWLSVIGWS